jgi:hypothetical protein
LRLQQKLTIKSRSNRFFIFFKGSNISSLTG